MPPKPKSAAITAIIKNINVHLNIFASLFLNVCGYKLQCARAMPANTFGKSMELIAISAEDVPLLCKTQEEKQDNCKAIFRTVVK